MADFHHDTRITMLLRKVNRKDQDLCSSYLQPIDPVNLNYEKMINENETWQAPTLEHTDEANHVRGCNHCLHVPEIPHPSIHIQWSNGCDVHYGDKFTFEKIPYYSALADNKQISHPYPQQTRGVPENFDTDSGTSLTLYFAKFYYDRSIIHLRKSFAALGQSTPSAEFGGYDLRTVSIKASFCPDRMLYHSCRACGRPMQCNDSKETVKILSSMHYQDWKAFFLAFRSNA
ncbi:hypothetical protein ACTXT7_009779 [Hymenolepis weldensis]